MCNISFYLSIYLSVWRYREDKVWEQGASGGRRIEENINCVIFPLKYFRKNFFICLPGYVGELLSEGGSYIGEV